MPIFHADLSEVPLIHIGRKCRNLLEIASDERPHNGTTQRSVFGRYLLAVLAAR